ncbi:MAG: substrate-binding domain-containing protein [Christensenellales bacterium]
MKKILSLLVVMIMVLALVAGCAETPKPAETKAPAATTAATKAPEATKAAGMAIKGAKPKIGYAQSRMNHPYRVAAIDQFKAAITAGKYDWDVVITDGNNDANKQTADVEDLIAQGCDIICMSPITNEALVPACQKVRAAGIPLILVDRGIVTEDYDYFVGGNNVDIGRLVGEDMVKRAAGKTVNVLEFFVTVGSSGQIDRDKGFTEILAKNPNVKLAATYDHKSMRDEAMKIAEDVLVAYKDNLFGIYSQNDEGALGILAAAQAAGVKTGPDGVQLYGTDGQKELFDQIKAGTVTGTCVYPTGTPETVEIIAKLLAGEKVERKTTPASILLTKDNVEANYGLGF